MWLSTWTDWAIFFVVVNIIHFLATWRLYQKAGRQAWEAAVPVYNAVVLMDIIKRPKWWVVMLFLPIIAPVILLVVWVDFVRCYGKRGIGDALLVIFTLGFYLFYLNYVEKPDYTGPEERKETFISAILFAVILATTVHTYFVQPMIIPTGSMENTLKIGDALFVSKNNYGTRLPMTPVAVPFADLFSRNLYVKQLQLPYLRIPGWESVEKNDIVVFNNPTDVAHPPIDRKENYVKRCVGTPGDVFEIKDKQIFINNVQLTHPNDAILQHSAAITFSTPISEKYLMDQFKINRTDYQVQNIGSGYVYNFSGISQADFDVLSNNPSAVMAEWGSFEEDYKMDGTYPEGYGYNIDWYGPLTIPRKGETIELNLDNLAHYIKIIQQYEDNDLVVRDGKLLLNGVEANEYTFQQNYYFMMGDNRHNSLDSRFMGFIPESYIIGKPFFLWANLNQAFGFEPRSGWQWDRWFTVPNTGNPNKTSYLWVGVLLLVAWFGYDFYRARKRKQNQGKKQ
ncbi:MAG: signal peptidase I [Weeksellaceae bacterium]|nr:signal peptidase I [Weeksellaceae bacterium]